eukprot:TRINITY_DN9359_c0_g1_i1.p1 TRINITY_DN9359_c0_g1~~TRINITY_DN9359_c0_g1_i1.p1  ORF type:complete len:620 (-),score=81.38 TRINITY_DN9359_c0_g1_i1:11-1870(-)
MKIGSNGSSFQDAALQRAIASALRTKPISRGLPCSALKKCLRLRDVVGFGLGVTIGGGIFVATGEAAKQAGPAVVLSFLLASLGCACSGLCYAEMARLVPLAGSSYSYAYTALGELAAFNAGVVSVVGNMLSGAAVARGWAAYFQAFLLELDISMPASFVAMDAGVFSLSPAAFFIVGVVAAVNCLGTGATASLNSCITATSLALLLVFITGGGLAVAPARWSPFMPAGFSGVVRGAGSVFFSYLGFDALACLTEEAEDPKAVPTGITITLVLATLLYCLTALVFTGLVTVAEVDVAAPLTSACEARGLEVVGLLISVAAVGNTLTTVVGSIVGSPRILYAMAQDGLVPSSLSAVNRRGVPMRALLCTSIPTALFAGLMEFGALADIVSAGALCNFSFVCAAVLLTRGKRLPALPAGCDASEKADAITVEMPSTIVGRARHISHDGADAVAETFSEDDCNTERPTEDDQRSGAGLVGDQSTNADGGRCTSLGRGLAYYFLLCMSMGLSLRAWLAGGALLAGIITFAMGMGVLLTGGLVLRTVNSDATEVSGTEAPIRPWIPLAGILMNVLMLSGLPTQALLSALIVDLFCVFLYFLYAAPNSRLHLLHCDSGEFAEHDC